MAKRLFCFGLGYSALALADQLAGHGWQVAGTCRDLDKARALTARGFEMFMFDRGRKLDDAAAALTGTTALISSVPPDDGGDPVLDHHGADIANLTGLSWVGYLSTTGVYGNRDGGPVDETSALLPTGPRGHRRAAAEAAWLALWRRHGLPVHIFRLAGIYGPGRSALDTVRRGEARRIVKPGQVFSRVHVEDIAQVLMASLARPMAGTAYNVCDDDPAAPQDVIAFACALLGVAPPPEIPFSRADLSPMARSFYDDNKRVANDRVKRELGVGLKYPSYRDGLADLFRRGR
ncbi:MAG: SDR family oxidoreductase [Alphaproteobacteria bacterium]|nr:SDR family oxidoreductase [Alphaproteobacteria bacterium]